MLEIPKPTPLHEAMKEKSGIKEILEFQVSRLSLIIHIIRSTQEAYSDLETSGNYKWVQKLQEIFNIRNFLNLVEKNEVKRVYGAGYLFSDERLNKEVLSGGTFTESKIKSLIIARKFLKEELNDTENQINAPLFYELMTDGLMLAGEVIGCLGLDLDNVLTEAAKGRKNKDVTSKGGKHSRYFDENGNRLDEEALKDRYARIQEEVNRLCLEKGMKYNGACEHISRNKKNYKDLIGKDGLHPDTIRKKTYNPRS